MRMAITKKVYGRRSASRTIHMVAPPLETRARRARCFLSYVKRFMLSRSRLEVGREGRHSHHVSPTPVFQHPPSCVIPSEVEGSALKAYR